MAVTVVEMAGMVGAGKTTLAADLVTVLEASGYRVLSIIDAIDEVLGRSTIGAVIRRLLPSVDRQRRALSTTYKLLLRPWYSLRFAISHPALTLVAARAAMSTPLPMWHRRTLIALFLRPAAAELCFRRRLRSREILLLEEGLLHRAVNVFAWGGTVDHARLQRYLAALPAADLVVLVTAPLDTCLARVGSRGLPARLEGHDDATVARFMANAVEVAERMTDALARSGRPAIVIDNGGDLETSVAALRAALDGRGGLATASVATTPCFAGGLRLPRHPTRLLPQRRASPRLPGVVVDQVLAAFGLTPTAEDRPVPGASRGDSVVVRTLAGDKLVKRYKATVPAAAVTHEHSILSHLARIDFPAPRLFAAPDGTTGREIDGRWFAVFDYQPGFIHYHEWLWPPGVHGRLTALSAEALAGLHRALGGITPKGANPSGFTSLDGKRWRELDWYLGALDRTRLLAPGLGGDGAHALRRMLDERAGAVEKELQALDAELASADLPRQVIHGDYGPYNLLFRRGQRVLILDFELARIDWRVADVAKALQQFGVNRYGVSSRRTDRFLGAYDRAYPLRPDEWRLLPSVWSFLTLRRVAVCWDRFCESGEDLWIREAERKLQLADMIRGSADRLTLPERSGTTRGDG